MMTLIIVVHVIVCVGLIGIILVQRGRGGGFVDSFAGLDSVFGAKTSSFLTKLTTTFAVTFFFTCLALAFLSLQRSRSLMRNVKTKASTDQTAAAVNATASSAASQQPPAAPGQVPANQTQATAPAK